MKAVAVFPRSRDVRVIDWPGPRMERSTDVMIRALEVGICGTDREIASFHYGTPPRGHEQLIIGHEMLGEVVDGGDDVTLVRPGDLVIPTVRRPCPHDHCPACRAGRQDFCYTGDFIERGIKDDHGYNTQSIVEDQRYLVPVPVALRDVAVLVEPLTIAEKALIQVMQVQQRLPWACQIQPGAAANGHSGAGVHSCHRAVVLGAGPVGLLGAMALTAAGFQTFVYSREPVPNRKAEICAMFGATYVSSTTENVTQLAERIGRIDLVYEAVGASSLAFEVMKVLGVNGIFIFTGVPGRKAPIEVDTDLLMRQLVLMNQVVFGTVNAGRDAFEAAISDLAVFMRKWPQAVRALITGRHGIDKAPGLLRNASGSIKEVIVHV
jgi:threonine dehydrogenase-like Zn-dependent dehydrogenase